MTTPCTILLVDDDADVREAAAAILGTKDYRVLVARTGDDAMRLLGQEHVDVLLTDIVMPEINGIELAEQAKWLQPDLKIMFMTGYYSRAAEATKLGALVFKPVRQSEIMTTLAEVLAAG
jgi:two-component system cell cycle response regulator CpdR